MSTVEEFIKVLDNLKILKVTPAEIFIYNKSKDSIVVMNRQRFAENVLSIAETKEVIQKAPPKSCMLKPLSMDFEEEMPAFTLSGGNILR